MKSIQVLQETFKELYFDESIATEYSIDRYQESLLQNESEENLEINEDYQREFIDSINKLNSTNDTHLKLLNEYEKIYGEFKKQASFVATLKKSYSNAIVTLQEQVQISEKALNLNMAKLRLEVNQEWFHGGRLAHLRLTTDQARADYVVVRSEELGYSREMKDIMDMRRSVNLLIHGHGDDNYIDKPYRQSHNLEFEKRKLEILRFKADVIKRNLKQIECDYYTRSKKTVNTTNEN